MINLLRFHLFSIFHVSNFHVVACSGGIASTNPIIEQKKREKTTASLFLHRVYPGSNDYDDDVEEKKGDSEGKVDLIILM